MNPKKLDPLATAPQPSYPIPLLWRRGAIGVRSAIAACSAGLCLACGAPGVEERPAVRFELRPRGCESRARCGGSPSDGCGFTSRRPQAIQGFAGSSARPSDL